jgi:nicotinamidase-related amidase
MKATTKKTKGKTHRLIRAKAALAVIDIQERLLPAIFEGDRVVQNTVRLIKGARILGVPVLVTEQYKKGLGATTAAIAAQIEGLAQMEKIAFSACGAAGFNQALKAKKISDVILCGIEAHVCVSQTCLDLLDKGFRVFVVVDAMSSRTTDNHFIAVERMRDAGGVVVSTEMVLFELLEKAGTDEFKQILTLVK